MVWAIEWMTRLEQGRKKLILMCQTIMHDLERVNLCLLHVQLCLKFQKRAGCEILTKPYYNLIFQYMVLCQHAVTQDPS